MSSPLPSRLCFSFLSSISSLVGQLQLILYLCKCMVYIMPYSWKIWWPRKLNLVVWWSIFATIKNPPNCVLAVYVYVQQSLTKQPNLNVPIHFAMAFLRLTTKFNSHQYFRLYSISTYQGMRIPYSGKNFHRLVLVTISQRKLLRNARTYHGWAQTSWRKPLQLALKP